MRTPDILNHFDTNFTALLGWLSTAILIPGSDVRTLRDGPAPPWYPEGRAALFVAFWAQEQQEQQEEDRFFFSFQYSKIYVARDSSTI